MDMIKLFDSYSDTKNNFKDKNIEDEIKKISDSNEKYNEHFPDMMNNFSENEMEILRKMQFNDLVDSPFLMENLRLKNIMQRTATYDANLYRLSLYKQIYSINNNLTFGTNFVNTVNIHSVTSFMIIDDYKNWELKLITFIKAITYNNNVISKDVREKLEKFFDLNSDEQNTKKHSIKDFLPNSPTFSNMMYSIKTSKKQQYNVEIIKEIDMYENTCMLYDIKIEEFSINTKFVKVRNANTHSLKTNIITLFEHEGNGFRKQIQLYNYFMGMFSNILFEYCRSKNVIDKISNDKINTMVIDRTINDYIKIGFNANDKTFNISHPFVNIILNTWEIQNDAKLPKILKINIELLNENESLSLNINEELIQLVSEQAKNFIILNDNVDFSMVDVCYGYVYFQEYDLLPYVMFPSKRGNMYLVYDPIIAGLPYTRINIGRFMFDDISINREYKNALNAIKESKILHENLFEDAESVDNYIKKIRDDSNFSVEKIVINERENPIDFKKLCQCTTNAVTQLKAMALNRNGHIGVLTKYIFKGTHVLHFYGSYTPRRGYPSLREAYTSGCKVKNEYSIMRYSYKTSDLKIRSRQNFLEIVNVQGAAIPYFSIDTMADNFSFLYYKLFDYDSPNGFNKYTNLYSDINEHDVKMKMQDKRMFFRKIQDILLFNNDNIKVNNLNRFDYICEFIHYNALMLSRDMFNIPSKNLHVTYELFRTNNIRQQLSKKQLLSKVSTLETKSSFESISQLPDDTILSITSCCAKLSKEELDKAQPTLCHIRQIQLADERFFTTENQKKFNGTDFYVFVGQLVGYACSIVLDARLYHTFYKDKRCKICQRRYEYAMQVEICQKTHSQALSVTRSLLNTRY